MLVVVLACNGPGSVIGFDNARTSNPPERFGCFIGIINVGGVLAAITVILGIGLVLDIAGAAPGHYTLNTFRIAFLVQFPVWALGMIAVRRAVRASR